jgi:hypothetical protein
MRRLANSGIILGILFLISPIGLYWFIHGSYERYIWIINQPFPLSHFGGGPFQLFMYVGLILVDSVTFVYKLFTI